MGRVVFLLRENKTAEGSLDWELGLGPWDTLVQKMNSQLETEDILVQKMSGETRGALWQPLQAWLVDSQGQKAHHKVKKVVR